jgi:hypothetical protein
LSTRLGGFGTLVGRRVANPPQADSLPHKFRSVSDTGKPSGIAHECGCHAF